LLLKIETEKQLVILIISLFSCFVLFIWPTSYPIYELWYPTCC